MCPSEQSPLGVYTVWVYAGRVISTVRTRTLEPLNLAGRGREFNRVPNTLERRIQEAWIYVFSVLGLF